MRPRAVAVVLAAGAGRRFGAPKAALHLKGRWMLPLLIRSLREGGAGEVRLVLSAAAEEAISGLGPDGADRRLRNPRPEAGRTGSLQIALDPALPEPEPLLVHPADIPLLRAEVVRSLLEAWAAAPDPGRALVRPVTPGGRGGHPLVLGPAWLPRVRALGPDESLRTLLAEGRRHLRSLRVAGDPGPFLDVDTPEQARFLESLLDGGPS